MLTGDGCNGEHIHEDGYVSAVYHVIVPDIVTAAGDNRGALALGCCEEYTGGYVPCWELGSYARKRAGLRFSLLTFIMMSCRRVWKSPRISVAADLQPC